MPHYIKITLEFYEESIEFESLSFISFLTPMEVSREDLFSQRKSIYEE